MSSTSPLTHFDAQGQAHMVDVGTKAADGCMVMTEVKLSEKQGGKSGHWVTQE
jgi:molybdenum cofactor biosynthesis enzyme